MAKAVKQDTKTIAKWPKAFAAAAAAALLVSIIALAFLWPSRAAKPRDYPLAVTGSNTGQLTAVEQSLAAGNTFRLVHVANRNEAINKIKHREVYGALIINAPTPEVLTASANGSAINAVPLGLAETLQTNLLTQMAQSGAPANTLPPFTVKVTDIVPAHKATFDLALLIIPLLFGGVIGGVITSMVVGGRLQRLVTLLLYAIFVSSVLYLILHTWFDDLPGGYPAFAGALGLGVFATSSFVAGSYVLLGIPGLVFAVVLTVLVANPLSGLAVPPVFLPGPWGTFGQYLTVGAASALVRGAMYFPVAGVVVAPALTLAAWAAFGAGAVLSRSRPPIRRH